jgi:hypothetical protein
MNMVAYCKCEFTDSDGTAVPGEPCQIHPKGKTSMYKHTQGPWVVEDSPSGGRNVYSAPLDKLTEINGETYREGLVALVYGHHEHGDYTLEKNLRLIAASPELLEVLGDLEMLFDEQTYDDLVRSEFDVPDDREFTVNISAKQLRAISQVLQKAGA